MAHLGRMHFRGEGIPKDAAQAMKWLKSSAAKGNARGLYHLAELHQNGFGVPVNHAEYAKLLRQAADRGSADAMAELGQCHEYGSGIGWDPAQAKSWYEKASEQPKSRFYPMTLAWMHQNGSGFPKDAEAAFEFAKQATGQGYADGPRRMGMHFLNGIGVPKNPQAALAWFTHPDALEDPAALVSLADMLRTGTGVPKDTDRAAALPQSGQVRHSRGHVLGRQLP